MSRRAPLALAAGLALALACTDLPTDPRQPVAISFDTVPAPSVVLGDTLRDSTGAPVPLRAYAYNVKGVVIPDARITFLTDSGVRWSAATGLLVADTQRAVLHRTIRIVADVDDGVIQSQPRSIIVTLRPDSLRPADSTRTTIRDVSFADSVKDSSPLRVQLRHRPDPAAAGTAGDTLVRAYRIRYRLLRDGVELQDSALALVDDGGRASVVDTTGTDGIAARRVRLRPFHSAAQKFRGDTVTVEASASYRGALVAGAPVTFQVVIDTTAVPRATP